MGQLYRNNKGKCERYDDRTHLITILVATMF